MRHSQIESSEVRILRLIKATKEGCSLGNLQAAIVNSVESPSFSLIEAMLLTRA